MGDLVLEGLVFFVFLDLVELDLEVVDLGVDALERMFVFLELDLAVLQCLLGGFELGLPGGEGRLAGGQCSGAGSQSISQCLGTLMQQVKVAEVVGRRGHQSRSSLTSGFGGSQPVSWGSIPSAPPNKKPPEAVGVRGLFFVVNRCSRGNPRAVDFARGAEVS